MIVTSLDDRIVCRNSGTDLTNPRPSAWTMRFPIAVASTGPASTGSPMASGRKLAEQAVLRPAADDVNLVHRLRGKHAELAKHEPIFQRQSFEDRTDKFSLRRRSGLSRPRGKRADRSGHVAGLRKSGSIGIDERLERGCCRGSSDQLIIAHGSLFVPYPACIPASSQSPPIFFRNRMLRPTPPSFVKLHPSAASVMIGCGISMPMRDQVPELMYAQSFPSAGTAATADAVSWLAVAITGIAR